MSQTDTPEPSMTPDAPGGVPSGAPGWMKLLLAVSLAINLAVAGMVAGVWLHVRADRHMAPPAQSREMLDRLGLGPLVRAFPPERRRELAQRLRAEAGDLRPGQGEIARDVAELVAALRAMPFEPGRVAQVLEAQEARLNERMARARALVLGEIARMNEAERRALADRLEAEFDRAMRRGRR